MVTIIFESHATTLDNEANFSSGAFDVELSETGKQQAQELGERYANNLPDAVFCSDLKRSFDTGTIAFGNRGVSIATDPRLREINYGLLNRQPTVAVDPLKVQHIDKPFPNGQSYQDCVAEMREFLQMLLEKYDGKTVMIIGHKATQYALEYLINGVPLAQIIPATWKWQPGWKYELKEITKTSARGFVPKPGQVDFTNIRWAPVINCLVRYQGRVLLVQRSSTMTLYPGYWNGVSGFLDNDGSLEDKVREEITEELGLQANQITDIQKGQIFDQDAPEYKKTWIVHPVLVDINTDQIALNWEAQKHEWVNPSELSKYQVLPGFEKVIKAFF